MITSIFQATITTYISLFWENTHVDFVSLFLISNVMLTSEEIR